MAPEGVVARHELVALRREARAGVALPLPDGVAARVDVGPRLGLAALRRVGEEAREEAEEGLDLVGRAIPRHDAPVGVDVRAQRDAPAAKRVVESGARRADGAVAPREARAAARAHRQFRVPRAAPAEPRQAAGRAPEQHDLVVLKGGTHKRHGAAVAQRELQRLEAVRQRQAPARHRRARAGRRREEGVGVEGLGRRDGAARGVVE